MSRTKTLVAVAVGLGDLVSLGVVIPPLLSEPSTFLVWLGLSLFGVLVVANFLAANYIFDMNLFKGEGK